MCAYGLCACMCLGCLGGIYTCVHVQVEARGQPWVAYSVTDSARVADQKVWGPPVFTSPTLELQDFIITSSYHLGAGGSQVLTLTQQELYLASLYKLLFVFSLFIHKGSWNPSWLWSHYVAKNDFEPSFLPSPAKCLGWWHAPRAQLYLCLLRLVLTVWPTLV